MRQKKEGSQCRTVSGQTRCHSGELELIPLGAPLEECIGHTSKVSSSKV